ncbi:MAG: endonuclease/exonuclease/phosphatase family protein [Candidatus Melainabacteria bacterium]|nr:endonuclease/exonuclease/phosphatase family protein [Candidatus Melainabacteria bacterium]
MKKPREICTSIGATILAPAAFIVICSVWAFIGFFGWPIELFAHFRVQYAVLLAMSIPYLLYLERTRINRFYITSCILALVANIAVVTLASTSFGREQSCLKAESRSASAIPLSLLQFNVNSSSTNYPAFDKLIEKLKPDVVCVEEVSEGWREHFEKLKNIYAYQSVRARTDNFGIGILSKYKIEHESREPIGGIGLPTIFIDLTLPSNFGESKQVQIVATHPLPPVSPGATTMRDKHMHELAKRIAQSQKLTILTGDFNCTPWSYIFADFVKESSLVDSRLDKGIQPTWPTMLPYMVIPIDHIFISPSIRCTEREVQENSGSDHYPVFAKFII